MKFGVTIVLSFLATFSSANRDKVALIIGGQSPEEDVQEDYYRRVELFGCGDDHTTIEVQEFPYQGNSLRNL